MRLVRIIEQGYIHKEMAARLRISVQIVKTHKANGMDKLKMKSCIDIVRYVMPQGWLQDTILLQT